MRDDSPATLRRTANLLGALACEVSDRLENMLKAHPNQTDSAAAALNLVEAVPAMSNVQLSQALKLSHPATVRLVAKLQSEGLIDVRDAADKRAVALHVTAKGRRRADALVSDRNRALATMVAALSDTEQQQLSRLLTKLLTPLVDEVGRAEYICRLCDFASCPHDACPVERADEQLRRASDG